MFGSQNPAYTHVEQSECGFLAVYTQATQGPQHKCSEAAKHSHRQLCRPAREKCPHRRAIKDSNGTALSCPIQSNLPSGFSSKGLWRQGQIEIYQKENCQIISCEEYLKELGITVYLGRKGKGMGLVFTSLTHHRLVLWGSVTAVNVQGGSRPSKS